MPVEKMILPRWIVEHMQNYGGLPYGESLETLRNYRKKFAFEAMLRKNISASLYPPPAPDWARHPENTPTECEVETDGGNKFIRLVSPEKRQNAPLVAATEQSPSSVPIVRSGTEQESPATENGHAARQESQIPDKRRSWKKLWEEWDDDRIQTELHDLEIKSQPMTKLIQRIQKDAKRLYSGDTPSTAYIRKRIGKSEERIKRKHSLNLR
ncbi:MAG: hypothetical protein N3D11_16540 [Candidatus Sumerlaeia bacterium]|nr:hypothetical protein [Candidatus Sumerlaeia bacterium]